jgi:hypothetical protein
MVKKIKAFFIKKDYIYPMFTSPIGVYIPRWIYVLAIVIMLIIIGIMYLIYSII